MLKDKDTTDFVTDIKRSAIKALFLTIFLVISKNFVSINTISLIPLDCAFKKTQNGINNGETDYKIDKETK